MLYDNMSQKDCWDLGEAADFIGDYCRKYGRISVTQTKEKWGEARVYLFWGWESFYTIVWPGYMYIYGYTRFLHWIKIPRILGGLVYKYQKLIYRRAYKLALDKWPDLRDNILLGADYPELLENL